VAEFGHRCVWPSRIRSLRLLSVLPIRWEFLCGFFQPLANGVHVEGNSQKFQIVCNLLRSQISVSFGIVFVSAYGHSDNQSFHRRALSRTQVLLFFLRGPQFLEFTLESVALIGSRFVLSLPVGNFAPHPDSPYESTRLGRGMLLFVAQIT